MSDDQKINIGQYFILSAPVGEVMDVIKDVKSLVNDPNVLTNDKLTSIMRDYNTRHFVSATAPNGEEVLVTTYGQIDASSYLDPATGKVLKFDHLTQTFTGETDQKQVLSENIASYRSVVEAACKTYVENNYKAKKCAFAVYGSDDGFITVCLSAKNSRLSSFWTGSIRSRYRLSVSKTGHSDVDADININVHYFEDGNVQLNDELKKTARIDVAEPVATAKALLAAIDKIETDYFNNLEEMYVNMHNQTFKAMRRFLPVSGQPMKWDSGVHGVAEEIAK